MIKRSALTAEDEESLKMEIQILQLTNHQNIVSVKEVFYCKNFVYLVMDLMTGGELFDRIVNKDHYTENEAKQALSQIAIAIVYCHDKNIVHRYDFMFLFCVVVSFLGMIVSADRFHTCFMLSGATNLFPHNNHAEI